MLAERIEDLNLGKYFTVNKETIKCSSGSIFFFKGIRHNIVDIKGLHRINICWVEEAEKVGAESWRVLIPTVRAPDDQMCEIWISFNPDRPDDYTYQNYVVNPEEDTALVKINYTDNPYCTQVLIKQAESQKKRDYELYRQLWLGEPRINTEALIFANKYMVEEFDTPDDAVFYHGADWGFSNDPTTIVRCFIYQNKLFIDMCAGGIGIEVVNTYKLFDQIPTSRSWDIQADSARPEVISHVKRDGFRIKSVKKVKIEEGIMFMQSFDQIIIHPRCEAVIEEFSKYSFKVDRHSGQITPIIVDDWNHYIDAIRYALTPTIRLRRGARAPNMPMNISF